MNKKCTNLPKTMQLLDQIGVMVRTSCQGLEDVYSLWKAQKSPTVCLPVQYL